MNPSDDELTRWTRAWRGDEERLPPDVEEAVRRSVRRKSRALVAMAILEIILTVCGLVVLTKLAIRASGTADRAVAFSLAASIAVFAGLIGWSRRGTFRPRAETTRAFLDLVILRSERRLSELRLGWVLLALEAAVFLPWLIHKTYAGVLATPSAALMAFGFLIAMSGAAAIFLRFLGARARHELGEAREALEMLSGDAEVDDRNVVNSKPSRAPKPPLL